MDSYRRIICSVLKVIEAAISCYGRGYTNESDSTKLGHTHGQELASIESIVQLVKAEEALQTANVASVLVKIEGIGNELVKCLGQGDGKTLTDIMINLTNAKSELAIHIQLANVGLTRARGALIANTEVINRINSLLLYVLGAEKGLKIAQLLENRPMNDDDGTVIFSNADIQHLNSDSVSVATVADPASNSKHDDSRVVINNLSKDQALQINGPIGEKGWIEVSRLEIRDNEACGESIQVNHATSMEVFDKLLVSRSVGLSAAPNNSGGLKLSRLFRLHSTFT